jgi:hypothetical protein
MNYILDFQDKVIQINIRYYTMSHKLTYSNKRLLNHLFYRKQNNLIYKENYFQEINFSLIQLLLNSLFYLTKDTCTQITLYLLNNFFHFSFYPKTKRMVKYIHLYLESDISLLNYKINNQHKRLLKKDTTLWHIHIFLTFYFHHNPH